MATKIHQRQKEKCASFSLPLSWNPREKSLCCWPQKRKHKEAHLFTQHTHTHTLHQHSYKKTLFHFSWHCHGNPFLFQESGMEGVIRIQTEQKEERWTKHKQTCGTVKMWRKDWNIHGLGKKKNFFYKSEKILFFNSSITTWMKHIKEAIIYSSVQFRCVCLVCFFLLHLQSQHVLKCNWLIIN